MADLTKFLTDNFNASVKSKDKESVEPAGAEASELGDEKSGKPSGANDVGQTAREVVEVEASVERRPPITETKAVAGLLLMSPAKFVNLTESPTLYPTPTTSM